MILNGSILPSQSSGTPGQPRSFPICSGIVFLGAAVLTTGHPAFAGASDKLWNLFAGANGTLLLALSVNGNRPTPPPPVPAGQ